MRERLETILGLKRSRWLRPRTGALRGGLSQTATTGNFGMRVELPVASSLRLEIGSQRRHGNAKLGRYRHRPGMDKTPSEG
jgi:hypothetical protein